MAPSQRPTNLTVLRCAASAKRRAAAAGLAEFLVDQRTTYTIDEAASLLGISRSTAYECARTGQLPVLRFGRRLLVTRIALLQLLDVDRLTSNTDANERRRTRRTRWQRVADHTGAGEPVADWARPHRQPPTE